MNNTKKEQEEQESEFEDEEVYIDSNLFISSVISLEKEGEKAREVINKIKEGVYKPYTSIFTLDEVMWIVQKFEDRDTAYETAKTILEMPNLLIIQTDQNIINKTLEIYKSLKLNSRDSIHLASMQSKNIKTIISIDSDFDRIKTIKRIDFSK